jgi:uncharacterized protein (TIGR03086 family)
MSSPTNLFERATARAADVVEGVRPDQLDLPTPCAQWSVQDLIDHMTGSMHYLLTALGDGRGVVDEGSTTRYRDARAAVLGALAEPGAEDGTCTSPLGFEWTIAEATAGTSMDNLVHTWDLARATGQDTTLDPALVEACTDMFLPDMPDQGRVAGLVGPAVDIAEDADPQERLLAAMGRHP